MYTFSEELTKNINSCNCTINSGIVLRSVGPNKQYKEVNSATLIVDLLSITELQRYKNIGSASSAFEAAIENVVVRDKVREVLGHPGYEIDINKSPAGSITTIAYAIFLKTKMHASAAEYSYNIQAANITTVEKMASIISYYMNIPYTTVVKEPVNEVYRKYAILVESFPSQVRDPFAPVPEEQPPQ